MAECASGGSKRPPEEDQDPLLPKKKQRSLAKKLSDKERDKTRINIGLAFPRWRALREQKQLQFDSELAFLLLDSFFQTELERNRQTQPKLDVCSSTESCESVHSDEEFTSLFTEEKQETFAALPAQSSIPGQEPEKTAAPSRSLTSSDEATAAELSENNKNRVGDEEDEEFSTLLSVGDGCYQVDLRSSSEFVVDEQCILELFKSCRKCNRRCMVRKRVAGLKIVVNQTCGFCPNRFEWTNLPDDENDRNDIDSQKKAQNTAASPS